MGSRTKITHHKTIGEFTRINSKNIKKTAKPGQHRKTSNDGKSKTTEYGIRLEEKQKLKFNYGISENQLYSYVKEARRRNGVTGLILLQLLEMRLDTICFSLGLASTIAGARQLVNHGHITVNNIVVDIPSFQCQVSDIIGIKKKLTSQTLVKNNLKLGNSISRPNNLEWNELKLEGHIKNYCLRSEILLDLNELLVIEYYSRR